MQEVNYFKQSNYSIEQAYKSRLINTSKFAFIRKVVLTAIFEATQLLTKSISKASKVKFQRNWGVLPTKYN